MLDPKIVIQCIREPEVFVVLQQALVPEILVQADLVVFVIVKPVDQEKSIRCQ